MKLLIVDDHPIVVSGIKSLLACDNTIEVLEAHDAETAEGIVTQNPPDVAIVDVNLPGASGFALTRWLIKRDALAKVVVFSMNDDPVFVSQARELGAKGFISKNDDPSRMAQAIHTVASGGTAWPAGGTRSIPDVSTPDKGGAEVVLSQREHEILRRLATGKSLSEIAEIIGVSYKTAAGTSAQLRTRLGARTQTELIRIAIERGWV